MFAEPKIGVRMRRRSLRNTVADANSYKLRYLKGGKGERQEARGNRYSDSPQPFAICLWFRGERKMLKQRPSKVRSARGASTQPAPFIRVAGSSHFNVPSYKKGNRCDPNG